MEFYEAELPPEAFDVNDYLKKGFSRKEAESLVRYMKDQKVVRNDDYQVNIRHVAVPGKWPMIHLSIKRTDKEPIHDWRVMQDIKNSVLGPEFEGVELYPAESRLTDTANQYHMWCLPFPEARFPFGFFDGRNVTDEEHAISVGAKQRKL